MPPEPNVQVLSPRLPSAERLVPYLRRIDETRVYSNWGPLTSELETRLARALRLPEGGVTTASSGTSGLVGALLGRAGRASAARPLAIVPAFTFVATAVAVEQCGYRPFFVDIDSESWMLEPEALEGHSELSRVGAVVPVAPFGRPVPQGPWQRFEEATGIPVVIDAAAAFDRLTDDGADGLGPIPAVLSFHATKSFATGEGGCVASSDSGRVVRVGQALNFGFHEDRDSRTPSTNGKMSEYHAAVGLAELDGWADKRRRFERVVAKYRDALDGAGFADRLIASPAIGASYALFRCSDRAESEAVRTSLRGAGIGHRLWYGEGLHRHAHFANAPRDRLDATEALAPCLLGIPIAEDLPDGAIGRVVQALAAGIGAGTR